ncbi:unnamed protein product [Phytomonas sp. EM1]|nr:unnamed protein product [Phytomonas sp. EM1]|eukprot:CCW63637.1 unnamed protein product [Phytomonas sp. isolate EM1]
MPRGTGKPGISAHQNPRDTKSLFFSLKRASFYDCATVSETVFVEFPATRNMKDALHEEALRRFLHKPYSILSNGATIHEDLSTDDRVGEVISGSAARPAGSLASASSSPGLAAPRGRERATGDGPYIVVRISEIRALAETVQQANDRGDLLLDVSLTLGLARVQYGMLFGVAEMSTFENYLTVRVPLKRDLDNTDKVPSQCAVKKLRRLESSDDEEGDAHGERKWRKSSHGSGDPECDATNPEPATREGEGGLGGRQEPFCEGMPSIEVLVRRQSEEPVVAGQVVLVVVEPGCIRCMGIRPPRAAPGPFRLVASKLSEETSERLAESKRRGKKMSSSKKGEQHLHPTGMDVVCDIPVETTK